MEGRVRRTVEVLARDARAGVAAVTAFWLGVGVLSALQRAAALRLDGGGADLVAALGRGAAAGLPWVPLTLGVVALSRRVPIGREGWARALAVHVPACLALPFVYNVLFHLLWGPAGSLTDLTEAALRHGLENLHLIAGTYWAVVAAERWLAGAARDDDAPAVLTVRSGRGVAVVPVEAVVWIEGAGDYARLHTEDAEHLSSETLTALARRLADDGFLRVHRSSIVRLDRVRSYRPLGHGDYAATLDDGTEVRVSRSYGPAFRRRMEG